ncbi:metal ABC transporter solute-binding protein, Zn/Mn family [Nitratiruptor sp. SB155-2]|uniref:metal ABC transporter solute-binding protein, Zn/Mn family n=1 Tax=Nitratiruptor sp. (strain SB155-2) TaxID=387092 RepID=UPI0001586E4A|nr:zinc ABC transporter substrate-binding protein [Nitratiruptor sp. SB155-2]BAF69464.1 Mn2+/Zn2+ ABC transporter, substrate-binding protein [Nitratiruptor sp. SB155-2]
MRAIVVIFFLTLVLSAKETILVSILPQKYIVNTLAPDSFNVSVLIPKGASPATFSLKPSQAMLIKKAKCYFTIGVPFEKRWLKKFKAINPNLKIVDMGEYVRRFPMKGHYHEHHHEVGLDPHIWLAPPYMQLIGRRTLQELCALDPQKCSLYQKNFLAFTDKIAKIDMQLLKMLQKSSHKTFLIFHPSLGYFAKVYGLRQMAIEEEGKEPKIAHLMEIAKRAKEQHIKTIFIEPQFPKRSAKFLAKKLHAKIVVIDPLAYKWDTNIISIGKAIAQSR